MKKTIKKLQHEGKKVQKLNDKQLSQVSGGVIELGGIIERGDHVDNSY